MLGEAKRELAAKELSERRAAFEALHAAMEARTEETLLHAIAAAKRTACDSGDVEKAEMILRELLSLTDEERRAKDRAKLVSAQRTEAFLCVKRNDAEKLSQLLQALPEGVRWQDWRDHAQRTLLRCSQDLRAEKVKMVLAKLMGLAEEGSKNGVQDKDSVGGSKKRGKKNSLSPKVSSDASDGGSPGSDPSPASPSAAPSAPKLPSFSAAATCISFSSLESLGHIRSPGREPRARSPTSRPGAGGFGSGGTGPVESAEDAFASSFGGPSAALSETMSAPGSPSVSLHGSSPQKVAVEESDEVKVIKAKAFKAVANNDGVSLQEVLDVTDIEEVAKWQNKAGESLLTLSEKRKSSLYAVMAKALGIVREQQKDAYEEKEPVWVYFTGDPQPRQATVLEDTPEEAETVLLQYWTGEEPAVRVEKARIRPSWS